MVEVKKTFFTESNTSSFPAPTDKDEIDAAGFLEASSHLARFFGLLGKIFYPVEADISGNVEKLRNFIKQHEGKLTTVNEIVVLAISEKDETAIDALLWLKRALEFTMVFIDQIVRATRDSTVNEDLNPICSEAYEKTLKKYHGWMAQQAFWLCSKFCPKRKDLLESLALGQQGMEDTVVDQMEQVLINLKKDVGIVDRLYTEHNLHSDAKV